jgi:hypothetical protein
MRRQLFMLGWLAAWLAAMLTYDYYIRIENPQMQSRMELHRMVVTGTAPYQYRYRVLIPYAADGLARVLQQTPVFSGLPEVEHLGYSHRAFTVSFGIFNFAAMALMLWAIGVLMTRTLTFELAMFGVALSAMMLEFTFRHHNYHPWSFWEGAFFAVGLLLIHLRRYWAFSVLSILALLNRETSVFLLLAFAAIEWPDARGLRFAIGNFAVWIAGFFALHRVVGYAPATFTIQMAIEGNRSNLLLAVWMNLLLIGIPLPLVWRGLKRAPVLYRRAALALPPYLALLFVIGYWWEIRYWITMLPIIVPLVALAVAPSDALPSR